MGLYHQWIGPETGPHALCSRFRTDRSIEIDLEGSDREIYEKEAMLQSVYDGYEGLVERGEMENLVVLDGEAGIDEVFEQARVAVESLIS